MVISLPLNALSYFSSILVLPDSTRAINDSHIHLFYYSNHKILVKIPREVHSVSTSMLKLEQSSKY